MDFLMNDTAETAVMLSGPSAISAATAKRRAAASVEPLGFAPFAPSPLDPATLMYVQQCEHRGLDKQTL